MLLPQHDAGVLNRPATLLLQSLVILCIGSEMQSKLSVVHFVLWAEIGVIKRFIRFQGKKEFGLGYASGATLYTDLNYSKYNLISP
jgi:hypothetical protein